MTQDNTRLDERYRCARYLENRAGTLVQQAKHESGPRSAAADQAERTAAAYRQAAIELRELS